MTDQRGEVLVRRSSEKVMGQGHAAVHSCPFILSFIPLSTYSSPPPSIYARARETEKQALASRRSQAGRGNLRSYNGRLGTTHLICSSILSQGGIPEVAWNSQKAKDSTRIISPQGEIAATC